MNKQSPLHNLKSWWAKNEAVRYASYYLGLIFIFSLIYCLGFNSSFKGMEDVKYYQVLYFSVVTITTLGYGDMTPALNSPGLQIAISIQVVLGLFIIGKFLDSLSRRISEKKQQEINDVEISKRKEKEKKALTILKPTIEYYLKIASRHYLLTSTDYKTFETTPKKLFNEDYFDQIALLDFYSPSTGYSNFNILAYNLHIENNEFFKLIESYLTKYSTYIDIDLILALERIQKSEYLRYPEIEIQTFEMNFKFGRTEKLKTTDQSLLSTFRSRILWEHSAFKQGPSKNMRSFYKDLLYVIENIDAALPEEQISIFISVLPTAFVPPNAGSAISQQALEEIRKLSNK